MAGADPTCSASRSRGAYASRHYTVGLVARGPKMRTHPPPVATACSQVARNQRQGAPLPANNQRLETRLLLNCHLIRVQSAYGSGTKRLSDDGPTSNSSSPIVRRTVPHHSLLGGSIFTIGVPFKGNPSLHCARSVLARIHFTRTSLDTPLLHALPAQTWYDYSHAGT